jgi:hypothetical protein
MTTRECLLRDRFFDSPERLRDGDFAGILSAACTMESGSMPPYQMKFRFN